MLNHHGFRRPLLFFILLIISQSWFTLSVDPSRRNRRGAAPPPPDDASALSTDDLTVVGQLLPAVKKFSLSSTNIRKVVDALKQAIDLREFALLISLGWASVPIVSTLHDAYVTLRDRIKSSDSTDENENGSVTKDFTETYLYRAVMDISNVAQIGALVFGVDCTMVSLNAVGFTSVATTKTGLSKRVAQISYTIWAGLRLSRLKHYIIERKLRNRPDAVVKKRLYNKVLNIVIGVTTGAIVFDCLDLNFGVALKSLLSFGGVGALIISLSSKDIATQFVSGLALSTGDKFIEGEEIQLGDGQAGIIEKIGLAYTDLRGYDEVTTRIPNSQLSQQRVRNISRVTRSQVQQELWFSYKDIDKMPALMEAIKEEVKDACGEFLISDGSRPFRAHWRDYTSDHLEVVVDVHFNIPGATQAYWDNKQVRSESVA